MGRIKIYCNTCHNSWEVYGRDINESRSRQCPNCLSEINGQTWEKFIVPAWGMMEDANRELIRDSTGYGEPLFNVSYNDKLPVKSKERSY